MLYRLVFRDNKEFNLDPEIIGLPGSQTIVDGMVQGKTRERRKIFLDGSSDEIVEKLPEILLENI